MDAADEVDAVAFARIVNAEQRSQYAILQYAHVERSDRIFRQRRFRRQQKPFTVDVHADRAGRVGHFLVGRCDGEGFFQAQEKFFLRLAVEVEDDAVVRQNFELSGREEHGQEPVVGLIAGVVRVGFAAHLRDAHGAGCAVVTVSDIKSGYVFEGGLHSGGIGNLPDGVDDSAGGGHAIKRRFLRGLLHQRCDGGLVAVGQENRAGLAVGPVDVFRPVVLFGAAGLFVNFDFAGFVVGHVAERDDAVLSATVHFLAVKIERRLGFAYQRAAGFELFKIFNRLGIHRVGIRIGAFRQINFRTGYAQERKRIAGGHFRRLFPVHHIVGKSRNFIRQTFGGPPCLERFDFHNAAQSTEPARK